MIIFFSVYYVGINVIWRNAAGRIMSMKNFNYTIRNRTPRPFGWYRSAWTNCATACSPSQFLYLAVHVQSTKENYSLLTVFDVPFTVFCDVCYIQFVPTVSLDLSSCRLKSLTSVRVSLLNSCLCIQGRCIYTEGPRTSHTMHFHYKIDSPSRIEMRTAQRETRHNSIFLVGGCPIGNRSRENLFFFFFFLMFNIYVVLFQNSKHVVVRTGTTSLNEYLEMWVLVETALW